MTHLYKTVALDHQRGSSKHSVVGVLEAVSRDGYWNFDAATVRQLCSEVVYSRGHPRVERHPVNEHITELLPEFPLTTLKITRHTSETPRSPGPPIFTFTAEKRGYCSPCALSSTFGVPQLPDTKVFAYCVKSKKMYKYLRTVLGVMCGAVTMGPIFTAAAMEELFIF